MADFLMQELFPVICNMSVTASAVILAVLAVRLLLRRAPKVFSYALWAVVLFRLLCPVSVNSAVSLMGALGAPVQERTQRTSAVEYVPADIVRSAAPEAALLPGEPAGETAAPPAAASALPAQQTAAPASSSLSRAMAALTLTWLAGAALLMAYSLVSLLRLRRRLVGAVCLWNNVYLADYISSPFVMGLIRPRIYLPSTLKEEERGYILRHEQYHIRRRDYLVKFLSFLALCIHWFNPLVWIAFILSGKDMEMSCDEAVVKELGEDIRADYSASLLSLATGRRIVAGMPLAFGEGDTGGRIRNLLKWKRPRRWVMSVCAVVCVGLIALCAANPGGAENGKIDTSTESEQWASVEAYVQHVMLSQTEVSYYTYNADGTLGKQLRTAAVTDRKLIYLEKGGEVTGLAPDGILEEWEYYYLTKPELDVDMDAVALAGGQYHDDEGYFDLGSGNRHIVVALRHEDNCYDILCDIPTNDGIFSGYHNTMEEAIYDWYVTEQGLDLPLYVEDWIDQINYNNPNDKPGNYPVHRYDVDGGYLYIPISGWTKSDTSDAASPYWEWTSAYNTGSIFSIVYDEKSLDVQRAEAEEIGFTPVDEEKQVWRLDPPAEGAHIRYYFYPAAGGGCWTVSTLWTDTGISEYREIFIEPQVMYLMAESFVPSDDFVPPASRPRQAVMKETLVSELSGGAIQTELTVQYTVELNEHGLYAIRSVDSAQARKLSGWTAVSASAEILQDQIVYLGESREWALVPVVYEASTGSGLAKYHDVVMLIPNEGGGFLRRNLSQEELDAYNAVTDCTVRDKSGDITGMDIHPASYLLTSYYGNVRNLNFAEFLRYFPQDGSISDEAEFEALKNLDSWPFKHAESMEQMPVPIHKISAASVNEVLRTWGGITAEELTDTHGVFYLKDYDAYYTYTSDFGFSSFAAESGRQVEDYVYLYGNHNDSERSVLTLRLTPGTGGWQIVSYLSLSE